jgi:hypothetical protein
VFFFSFVTFPLSLPCSAFSAVLGRVEMTKCLAFPRADETSDVLLVDFAWDEAPPPRPGNVNVNDIAAISYVTTMRLLFLFY